jgi:hypothetical protein
LRVCPRFRECTSNRIHNRVDVLVQLLITEAEQTKAARGEPVGAALIVFSRIRLQMLRTVEFDDQLDRKANEVNHVGANRRLATELMAVELPGAEEMPKAFFGAGGLARSERAKSRWSWSRYMRLVYPLPNPPRKGEGTGRIQSKPWFCSLPSAERVGEGGFGMQTPIRLELIRSRAHLRKWPAGPLRVLCRRGRRVRRRGGALRGQCARFYAAGRMQSSVMRDSGLGNSGGMPGAVTSSLVSTRLSAQVCAAFGDD